jgi:Family of unknown function (DUF5771)
MPSACPPGTIRRVGYTATRSATGTTYKVPSACVADVGKPGKTPRSQRIVATPDISLETYGYAGISKMSAEDRHDTLAKAIRGIAADKGLTEHVAAVKVMRYVNLMSIYNRNTNPTVSLLMERDRNWIGRVYLGKNYTA